MTLTEQSTAWLIKFKSTTWFLVQKHGLITGSQSQPDYTQQSSKALDIKIQESVTWAVSWVLRNCDKLVTTLGCGAAAAFCCFFFTGVFFFLGVFFLLGLFFFFCAAFFFFTSDGPAVSSSCCCFLHSIVVSTSFSTECTRNALRMSH